MATQTKRILDLNEQLEKFAKSSVTSVILKPDDFKLIYKHKNNGQDCAKLKQFSCRISGKLMTIERR